MAKPRSPTMLWLLHETVAILNRNRSLPPTERVSRAEACRITGLHPRALYRYIALQQAERAERQQWVRQRCAARIERNRRKYARRQQSA